MKLLHGDCFELMKDIEDNSIDLILADAPFGTTYAKFEKVLKNGSKFNQKSMFDLEELWNQYKRILKPNGNVVMFGSQPFTTVLISSNYEWFKYNFVWEKNKAANHVAVKFQPLKIHEDIIVCSRSGCNTGSLNPIKYNPQDVIWNTQTKTRKNDIKNEGTFRYNSLKAGDYEVKGTNYPKSILRYDIPNKDRIHPTEKPISLLEYLIKTFSDEGNTVLDNFAGSFSTGIACFNTNREFIGIERDDEYFTKGTERLMKYSKKLNLDGVF